MTSPPEQSSETEALRTAAPAIPDVEPGATPPVRIRREAFRALRYRNFRLLFTGTILSQTGDFLQIMAQGWLVITLTGSPLSLGVVGFCQSVPRLVLGVVAGMLADRFERRRLLFLSQAGMMIQSLLFAVLVSTHRITFAQIIVLTLVWGALNAINQTARASLIPALVPREEMLNAIAIHSSGFNLTRVLGPALGGALVGLLGVAGCLWINAASFLPMLWALRAMEFGPTPPVDHASAPTLSEAIRFIRRERDVLVAIGLTYAVAFFALPYSRLLPAFARDVFHSGPGGYGLLMASGGVGAVASTLALATWGRAELFARLLPAGTILLGVALVAFVSSPGLWAGVGFLFVFGALQLGLRTVAATIIQTRTPDDLRGRVTGIFLMDIGVWSLGTLAIAALAEVLGVRAGVGIGAALCAGSGILALRAYPRRKKDLPPDFSA